MNRHERLVVAVCAVVVFALTAGGGFYTAALFSDSTSIDGHFSTADSFSPNEETAAELDSNSHDDSSRHGGEPNEKTSEGHEDESNPSGNESTDDSGTTTEPLADNVTKENAGESEDSKADESDETDTGEETESGAEATSGDEGDDENKDESESDEASETESTHETEGDSQSADEQGDA